MNVLLNETSQIYDESISDLFFCLKDPYNTSVMAEIGRECVLSFKGHFAFFFAWRDKRGRKVQ